MKSILYWFVLIVSIAVLVSSCAKSDDSKTASTDSTTPTDTTAPSFFVGVGYLGNIVRSTDNGSSWDNATSPTANHLNGVTFGNNTFVGVGLNGKNCEINGQWCVLG